MRLAIAGCLLVVAYAAHALGFCWAAAAIAYVLIARKASPRLGAILFAGALCAVIGLRFLITARYPTFWSPHQVLEATAIDQVWTFGLKYCGISVGLGMLWGFLFLRLSHALSVRQIAESLPFQLCCLLSAGVLLIPTRIELPAFNSALSLIAERLTLLLGILICAFLGSSKPDRWQIHSLFVLAIVYFSFLYVDTSALNRSERSVETLLSQIPPGQRVFSSFTGKDERVLLWPHAVDRACIGRCISYNNYEPRSAAFRIHAIAENPSVVWKAREYSDLSNGGYLVREEDLPLYQLQTCEPAKNSICIKALIAGEVTKGYPISLLPVLW